MCTAEKQKEQILDKIRAFCAAGGLLAGPGLHVVAAVSGGADSMALLLALLALSRELGFSVSACHVNHGLRGATADRDEAFVAAACARLGVPLRVYRAAEFGAVPPHAGEDWARRLRYACFERALKQAAGEGITRLATAHTATDQAETLLFRLARGAGLHGAAGIRPVRGEYIRPLLCLTREQTEALCSACGETWVTDETNATDAYARNRLRHAALPALRSANAAAELNLARFCEKAAEADEYFASEGRRLLNAAKVQSAKALPAAARYAFEAGQPVWRAGPLQEAHELILAAALHSLVSPVRDAEEKYIAMLLALVRRGEGAVQLTAKVRFCAGGGVFWREQGAPPPAQPAAYCVPFCPEKQAEYSLFGGYKLKTRVFDPTFEEKTQRVHKKDLKNQADYAKIVALYPECVLRGRLPGDKYAPPGRKVDKQLRKWMNEAGIPPCKRDVLPLLASGDRVLWVCGAGFASGLEPGSGSTQVLQLWEEVEP